MQGPPSVRSQTMSVSNSAYRPVAMRAQALSGNRATVTGPVTLIGTTSTAQSSGTQAVVWPAGTRAGDSALIFASRRAGSNPTLSTTGGTTTTVRAGSAYNSSTNRNAFFSVMSLTDGDVRSPPSVTQDTGGVSRIVVYVFRYATAMTARTTSTPGAGVYTDLTLTGFTARPGSMVLCWNEDADKGSPDTLPAPFASYRYSSSSWGIADTFMYRSGNVVLTAVDGSVSGLGGGLIEVY